MDQQILIQQLEELCREESWYVPLLSNVSALLFETMEQLNWAGFYLVRDGRLVLGPFQGKAACIHIPFGKGVCGTAAANNKSIRVEDVHAFPGHIACDGASRSELVIPIHAKDGKVIGVLDLDSPARGRFQAEDQEILEALIQRLEELPVSW